MRPESILFFAMAAQILLTLGLMLRLALGRYDEARSGKVDLDRARLDNTVWSEGLTKLSNSVDNQFQTPVLFYAGVLAALHFGAADWLIVALAVAYVALRYLHALVHTGGNVLVLRFQVFILSFLVLAAYWIYFTGWMVGRAIALA